MMHSIERLTSGFYGLKVTSTGQFYRADLIPWDGKRGTAYPYDMNETFEFYQDAENTVYYTDKDGANARVWCSGSRLAAHCHHLHQIHNR